MKHLRQLLAVYVQAIILAAAGVADSYSPSSLELVPEGAKMRNIRLVEQQESIPFLRGERYLSQVKHDMPQMKFTLSHVKRDMPQLKLTLPYVKRDMPQMKLTLPQIKRDMPCGKQSGGSVQLRDW
jgi:hypothetical protein